VDLKFGKLRKLHFCLFCLANFMKKIRKNTQLNFINLKRAGRPAKNDRAIRHIERPKFHRMRSLHLTIKIRENKADIQNKRILIRLAHSIQRARLQGLKVLHFALEYNHVHLLVEAGSHEILHKAMQALGISFAKGINKIKSRKGAVYKHRYHFRQISTPRDLKNVIHYILQNHRKHRSLASYRSLKPAVALDEGKLFRRGNFLFHVNAKLHPSERSLLYE